MRNIEHFSYRLFSYCRVTPILCIFKFMSHNPQLQVVDPTFSCASLSGSEGLGRIHLPLLHTFTIVSCRLSPTAILSFLHRNPTIQVLAIDIRFYQPPVLFGLIIGTLPNLHTFICSRNGTWLYICSATPPLRHLQRLGINNFDEENESDTAALLAVSETLESITVDPDDEVDLVAERTSVGRWAREVLPH
ncbi:hypothetical protein JAAARDRAFT_209924, partial [Jaapia argillacea MUCL 33604]